MGAKQTVE
jgi:hypothetical protein